MDNNEEKKTSEGFRTIGEILNDGIERAKTKAYARETEWFIRDNEMFRVTVTVRREHGNN